MKYSKVNMGSRSGLVPSASEIRSRVLEIAFRGQTVHIPSAFSIVELVRILYANFDISKDCPSSSNSEDYFILSKGHGVMAMYPILESLGWISRAELDAYFTDGGSLPGLAESSTPGVLANSGSLGMGIGISVGLCYADALRGNSLRRHFCLIGDGELNEGSVYEALRFAGHNRLGNFKLLVDWNEHQAMGKTSEVLAISDALGFFASLGFDARIVDGHDEERILDALTQSSTLSNGKPLALVALTVKGKGVSFMENKNEWHYTRLTPESFTLAMNEVR